MYIGEACLQPITEHRLSMHLRFLLVTSFTIASQYSSCFHPSQQRVYDRPLSSLALAISYPLCGYHSLAPQSVRAKSGGNLVILLASKALI